MTKNLSTAASDDKTKLKKGNAERDARTRFIHNEAEAEANARSDEPRTGSVDFIVAEILRGLHEGRYVPGQKLTESDLTHKYGVGRGSVREALRKLESGGLIAAALHQGARIRIFSREAARDVLEVYEHLACLAAGLAAERLGQKRDAEALRNILAEMAEQLKRGESFETARLRYRFLAEVVALTRNQELRHLMPRSDVSVLRAQFRNVFDLQFAKEDLEHLRLVVDAILARNSERAAQAMRQYSQRFGIAIQQSPDIYFAH
ncbi:MAG TPA: GntR family transcriptional regulator [Paraburkholderia sp.]|uniref:GntR family transcriptional regulator n=1 Tax=Paraburkholderia sp. TaxID=1926495 RepID=UPI002B45CFD3|nr:GntR family transcriptional regulator [Paraburkholderia sp.]HKR47097.1 GntR family transcriptional regulator [Paraburkholderia sp.]